MEGTKFEILWRKESHWKFAYSGFYFRKISLEDFLNTALCPLEPDNHVTTLIVTVKMQ